MRFLAVFLFSCIFAHAACAQKYADILMDAHTGIVMHGTEPDGKRYPASLTKIMTLYIIFEALKAGKITLNTTYPVSKNAIVVEPCKLGLRVGQRISIRNIILGLITKSANDASVVIAEGFGGSIARFADKMNHTARKLGMNHTHFRNPHGLPDPHQVTTARDMAILSKAIIKNYPEYYKLFKTRFFVYGGLSHPNHNSLLGRGGIDGIKTGFFRKAGSNLAASAVRTVGGKQRRLIAIVLGGENRFARNRRIMELLNRGFGQSHGELVRDPIETKPKIEVENISYVEKSSPNHSMLDIAPVEDEESLDPISNIIHQHEHKISGAPLIYRPVSLPKPIEDKIHNRKPVQPAIVNIPVISAPKYEDKKGPQMVWVKGTLDNVSSTSTTKMPTKIIKKAARIVQKSGQKRKNKAKRSS